MRARLTQLWVALRESYWFLPALLSLFAVGLAVAATIVDRTWGPWSVEWIPPIRAEGARSLLSTAAGSLITVAGVAISVTLVALASTSSQFGPRLLVHFLRDRGIQLALALFAASFLNCLVVLLFVRSAAEQGQPFVPQLAIGIAFLASIVSVGTFIYLVHHVAQMLHVGNVVARSGEELLAGIVALEVGWRSGERVTRDDLDRLGPPPRPSAVVRAPHHGYLQVVDVDTLVGVAARLERTVAVAVRVGEFVTEGVVIARAWPEEPLAPDDERAILDAFAWGTRRTHEQDVQFQVEQLRLSAARALSPGVKDPFTAMGCIHWLEAAIRRFGYLPPGAWIRRSASPEACVLWPVTTFKELLEAAVDQLIPYAAADPNAARHLARALRRQEQQSSDTHHRELLAERSRRLREATEVHLADPVDVDGLAPDERRAR